ncbi:MAG: hypothetical protein H6622_03400 [Halobacteriovoraceae bacterium]|nr:hypothetical protein [Halobacteriovoraceae bacterium]
MEAIAAIFKRLEIDNSFYFQFAIFIILFFVLDFLLFSKLKFVLEQREAKTTKLKSKAENKFNLADEIAIKYKDKLDVVHKRVQDSQTKAKADFLKEIDQKIKNEQDQINSEINTKRKELIAELDTKKTEVFKEIGPLGTELINKLENA